MRNSLEERGRYYQKLSACSSSETARPRIKVHTGVLVLETLGGLTGNSLTLLMDAVHNLSDELGPLFLIPT